MALEDRRPIPVQAQPAQIGLDRLHGASTVARGVEIIDAQQPDALALPGLQP